MILRQTSTHDLELAILLSLSRRPDGSAHYGELARDFPGERVALALEHLDTRGDVNRYQHGFFHVTRAGRQRIEARALVTV